MELIFLYIFGLIMGSFLGVIIDRLPKNISIAKGRSRCEYCERDLAALELIPVLSYVLQKGQCRKCKTKLSLRYPLLEILTGLAYVLVYNHFGYTLQSILGIAFVSILIVITFIDLDTMIINDRFQIMILIIGIIDAILLKKDILNIVGGALIISIPLLILAMTTGGIGGGDIKLMFVSGIYLGFYNIIAAFVFGVVVGGIYGIVVLIKKSKSRKDAIPFGPFLAIGLFFGLVYGTQFIQWYVSLLWS